MSIIEWKELSLVPGIKQGLINDYYYIIIINTICFTGMVKIEHMTVTMKQIHPSHSSFLLQFNTSCFIPENMSKGKTMPFTILYFAYHKIKVQLACIVLHLYK